MEANETVGIRSRSASFVGLIVSLFTFGLYSAWIAARFGFDVPPSSTGDELSYDSVAWELSQDRGFAIDYADADFRRPYDQAAVANPGLYAIPETASGPIAFRPPLFPIIYSIANRVTGRHFYLIRIFNVLCMAATAGLIGRFLFARLVRCRWLLPCCYSGQILVLACIPGQF